MEERGIVSGYSGSKPREVKMTKVEAKLEPMNSYERRAIHNILTNNKFVYTKVNFNAICSYFLCIKQIFSILYNLYSIKKMPNYRNLFCIRLYKIIFLTLYRCIKAYKVV